MSQEIETKVAEPMSVPSIDQAATILIPEVASAIKQPVTIREGPLLTAQDLSCLFFHSPTSRPDGVFEPLLCEVIEQLKMQGVPPENLKQALMLVLGAVSAPLGYPLAMLLVADEPLTAARLVESSTSTVPAGWTIKFDTLSPSQLFINGGEAYRDKCIVCQDPEGLVKVARDLDLMLTRGYAVRQEILNKKYAMSLEEFRADCFPSFIGIESHRKRDMWKHPSIVKIPVTEGLWGYATPQPSDGHSVGLFRIRKCFKRLRPRPVVVPFNDVIERTLAESGVSHADILQEVVMKIIALVAIINQPPPVTMHEIGSYIYEIDESRVMKWLENSGEHSAKVDVASYDNQAPITATKIDYHIAKILLESFVRVSQASLTERQMKIFQTIKMLNWGKFQNSTIPNATDIKKIATLPKSSMYWPDREKIYEVMNHSGGEVISLTTINSELIELCKIGIIGREKAPKQRYYGYFVMTVDVDNAFTLPPVSEIVDPVYQGKEVNVVNPITGQIEKI